MKTLVAACLSLCLCLPALCLAAEPSGQDLVNKFWRLSHGKDHKAMAAFVAEGFQSIHHDGAKNRAQELELLRKVNLSKYVLSDFKTSHNGPLLVVTYRVTVSETLHGVRKHPKGAPRMSIFLKTAKGWQLIAHANLNPAK